jgi:hypothetical protein
MKMTPLEASALERAIIDSVGTLSEVTRLMSLSGRLWHDTMHGILDNIKDRKILDKIDKSSFVLPDLKKRKYAKYESLREVANYFALLADTFLAIEESVDRGKNISQRTL